MTSDTRTAGSTRLADLTTLHVGGPAQRLVTAISEAEIVAAVTAADANADPLLILGGGSNVLIADAGWPGTVLLIRSEGVDEAEGCGAGLMIAEAGEDWDRLVESAAASNLAGIECLSGIPGSVGATPIQNVGAYGQEVADVIERVRVFDRRQRITTELRPHECGFSYRDSRFKRDPDRFVVLSVALRLERSRQSRPIRYPELARALGVGVGDRAPLDEVRAAVLHQRRDKGMVLDPGDHDTWSAGSFFTNPIVPADLADALPADAPRFPVEGGFKLSAAWLIESAGFGRGYGDGTAQLSGKHTLALTNRGGASAQDLLDLARTIAAGVRDQFGIALVPEPNLVNCRL
jgi:UDP-N-acetylmuramate dehydrogenase